MSTHPTLGVPGSKPRMPKAEQNGSPASKEELSALNHEYLRSRNSQMASKVEISAMELARRRGELLDKKLVYDSVAYVVTVFANTVSWRRQSPHGNWSQKVSLTRQTSTAFLWRSMQVCVSCLPNWPTCT